MEVLAFVVVMMAFHQQIQALVNQGELDESIQKYQKVSITQTDKERTRRSLYPLSTLSKAKKGHREEVTFVVEGKGKKWLLDLRLNDVLLPQGSKITYTGNDGKERSLPTQLEESCYYQGVIHGVQHSSVALSTCQGLEGLIFDGHESYYIQPYNNQEGMNSHIMYKMKDLKLADTVCDQNHHANFSHGLTEMKKNRRFSRSIKSEPKYIELVMVNDISQFNANEKDLVKTASRSRTIANLVDSLYRAINVRVALIELIIWNNGDPILVDEDSSKALENFNEWRKKELIQKRKLRHDNAQLLTHIDFKGATVGKAHVLAICTTRSAGVVQDHSTSAASTASTFAHEMGHNLGMGHDPVNDDSNKCSCSSKKDNQDCIMSGVARSVPATDWSSCSVKEFNAMLEKGLDSCLFNKPKKLYGSPICGNGFVEEGEDCDCGTPQDCAKYTDHCCNSTTCKLLSGAQCDGGPCCDKCKMKPKGVLCREKVTECDLPEHCTGKSATCPDNRFVYHGKPCRDGKGYCNQGVCPTHDSQCEVLWGDDVSSGSELCYTVNMRGTAAGNCDKQPDGTYVKCKYKDIYCGMLHCTNTKTNLPIIGTERKAFRYKWHIDGKVIECRSSSVELGVDADDPGMTREGTKCGNEMVCLSNKCVNITELTEKYVKCPNDCSGNGICDSNGECYCDDCWAGSDCKTSAPCLNKKDQVGRSTIAGYIILVFLILATIVGCVAAFVHRDKLREKWRQRKNAGKRYESTEASSPTNAAKPGINQTDNKNTPFSTSKPQPRSNQGGKIELPSWPSDGHTNHDIARAPRRPPPGPPNPNRASSPPGSIRNNPMFNNQRPDSYAGVLDNKPGRPVAIVPPHSAIKPGRTPPPPPNRPGQPPTPNRPGQPPPPNRPGQPPRV